jgi:hypothetical protein
MGNYFSGEQSENTVYSSDHLDKILSGIPSKNKVVAEKVNFIEIPDRESRFKYISSGVPIKKNCDFISNLQVKLYKGDTLLFDSVNSNFEYKPIIFDYIEKTHFSLNGVKNIPVSIDGQNDIFIALLITKGDRDIVNTDNFLLEISYDGWDNVNMDFTGKRINGTGYEFSNEKTTFRYTFLQNVISKYCKHTLL